MHPATRKIKRASWIYGPICLVIALATGMVWVLLFIPLLLFFSLSADDFAEEELEEYGYDFDEDDGWGGDPDLDEDLDSSDNDFDNHRL
ncbi:hypothetical protein [Desulfurispira natronophila]|uniref:Uncharacterized protein n=1 Tax=Desulfurispira natronophila TaxID=682562 RepID=A0A7W7Y3H2_9BACT|nr:hypothetical protein [Desulfurispira natronophila]MBB5021373.1 hypothetical protein [Desulfurispira natronophila]